MTDKAANSINIPFWRRHLTIALMMGSSLSTVAQAQEQQPQAAELQAQAEEEEKKADEAASSDQAIVVTGSKIARKAYGSPIPLVVLTSDDLERTGTLNVGDLLNDLPAAGSPSFNLSSGNLDNVNQGIVSMNLRNLGDGRTLLLVDGQRIVAAQPGFAISDLSIIPPDMVARIEQTTGATSAVYGSSAVAGVINIILKDRADGLSINTQAGTSQRGDGESYHIGATWGASTPDDRGHAIIHLAYDRNHEIWSRDRRFSRLFLDRDPGTGEPLGIVSNSAFPGGVYFGTAGTSTTTGPLVLTGSGEIRSKTSADNVNLNEQTQLVGNSKRMQAAFNGSYDILDGVTLFGRAFYTSWETTTQNFPLILLATGSAPQRLYGFPGGGVPLTNPFIPAPLLQAALDSGATGIAFERAMPEVGRRTYESLRQTIQTTAGLRGTLPFRDWAWEATYSYGRQTQDARDSGFVHKERLRDALDVILDPVSGIPVCRDPIARAEGCVPANIFGANTLSPEAASYIAAIGTRQSKIDLQNVSFDATGSLADLPGGPLGIAFGAEWHQDSHLVTTDPLWQSYGLANLQPNPDLKGSISAREAFIEINAPLLRDRPFANYLAVDGAYRIADYSHISGSTGSWKVGAVWEPIRDIRFRGAYATGVRAPEVGHVAIGLDRRTPGNVQDLCSGVTATSARPQDAGCRLVPGIAASITASGDYVISTADRQSILVTAAGNPDIGVETAKTFTIGAVLQPRFIPNLSFSLDYFKIKVADALSRISVRTIQENCYIAGVGCDLVRRDPVNGALREITQYFVNLNQTRTSGIDFGVNYSTRFRSPLGANAARLSIGANATWLDEYVDIAAGGGIPEHYEGLLSAPKWRGRATVTYQDGPATLNWTTNYLGKQLDPTLGRFEGTDGLSDNPIKPYWYHDAQVRYKVTQNHELYLGVNNIFDKDPPWATWGSFAVASQNTQTYETVYDVVGRYFYAGVNLKF